MSVVTKCVENRFFITIWRRIRKSVSTVRKKADSAIGYVTRRVVFRNTPVQNNKVVFMTYKNAFECNPKYIAEELLSRGDHLDLVWVIPKNGKIDISQFPEGIKLVKRESYEFYNELASAKVWVDNSLNFMWMPFFKKDNQCYIETWHGSMGLKRAGKGDVKNKRWVNASKRVTKYTDYCISDSSFENEVYRETHWPNAQILEYGHPRNDILINLTSEKRWEMRAKIAKELGFDPEDKVVLYAPTFRDSGTLDCYNIDFDRLVESLSKRFGGNWKVLMRLHFHDRSKSYQRLSDYEFAIDATGYLDMQELLSIADAGITDYSSWSCDYVLTGRPCFIYATDIEEYNTERGLYYPLEETPFPVAVNNDELMQNIDSFDGDVYEKKRQVFLQARGCWEDGHASERAADKILKICGLSKADE